MPPTRGHDLKHINKPIIIHAKAMPPTRGHDLKLQPSPQQPPHTPDAPHTGARLETKDDSNASTHGSKMAPTRGHDLKLGTEYDMVAKKVMPPTRGHDLKLQRYPWHRLWHRCPPHGGTT